MQENQKDDPQKRRLVGGSRDHLFVAPKFVKQTEDAASGQSSQIEGELRALRRDHNSDASTADHFKTTRVADTQTEFYPLISQLFQLMGFDSDYSRAGVNYQRWDAWVRCGEFAIPIEIKSPTEEMFLSNKAVRQAVENKVVLLARGGLATSKEITSLIVGFELPNERGDMSQLIDDIYDTFGLSIGVVDLKTLTTLAIKSVVDGETIDDDQLNHLKGFLHV